MPRTLTDQLLDAHADAGGRERWALRVDHAVAAGDAALLVLAAFAATGRSRARADLALVCADSRTAVEALGGSRLQAAAGRAGARFAPPGLGRALRVHLERLAAPGRVACACGARLDGAGGVATLALTVDALELAATWAGAPLAMERPRVVRIALEGAYAEATGAVDVMLALAASARAPALRGCVLEFDGPGVAATPVDERIAASALASELDVLAVLWPSDDATRGWLAERGRESEWKRLAADPDTPFDRAVGLDGLEPATGAFGATPGARPAREEGVRPVSVVVLGPATPSAAFAMLARALAQRTGALEVPLVAVPGSGALADALERAGVLAVLGAAGVSLAEHVAGVPLPARPDAEAVGMCFGIDRDELPGAAGQWRVASAATCIASALAGRVEDARGAPWLGGPDVALPLALAPAIEPPADAASEPAADGAVRALELPPVPGEALRGPVLARLGDDVSGDVLLRWGPRLRPLLADVGALAEHALEEPEPGFAARARAAGAGFLVAGERFGGGVTRDSTALVLAALGVRAVLARSFSAPFAVRLAAAGVLPLTLGGGDDLPEPGAELEIPALAEGLAAGRPLAVRDLSSGRAHAARLELDPEAAALARAGGRLRAVQERS